MPVLSDLEKAKRKRNKPVVSRQPGSTGTTRFQEINTNLPNSPTDQRQIRGSLDALRDSGALGGGTLRPSPRPVSYGGGGGGGGRSYGGGSGGGAPAVDYQGQVDFLTRLLGSSAFTPRQNTYTDKSQRRVYARDDAIYDRVAEGVAADRRAASGAYDALDAALANVGPSAYEQLGPSAVPQVDRSLLQLLSSQGVDPAAYTAAGDLLQGENRAGAGTFDDLIRVLGANEQSSLASRRAEAAMARAFADRSISAQSLGLNTALDLREQARRREIEDQNFAIDQSETARQRQVQDQNIQLALAADEACRQLITQLSAIAAQGGVDQPTLEALGIA